MEHSPVILTSAVERFRKERLDILANAGWAKPLGPAAKIVIHMLPERPFESEEAWPGKVPHPDNADLRGPYTPLSAVHRDAHGTLYWDPNFGQKDLACAYLRVFPNGALEGVDTAVGGLDDAGVPHFNPAVDGYIANGVSRYLSVLGAIKATGPIHIAVSLVGAKGYAISPQGLHRSLEKAVGDDLLLLPTFQVEGVNVGVQQIARLLRPTADALYRSAGYEGSWNYEPDGRYRHMLGFGSVG